MYENYYGLKSKPFCLVPDPNFLFSSATFKRGIAYLHYGIERGEGIIVISGEAGTGKSFLIHSLLDDLTDDEVIVRMLITPSLDADELVSAVLTCFGIKPVHNKAEQLDHLKNYLLARAHENKRVILAVDEAHCLSQSALEELRMLSNFQLGERALLQMFLLGQSVLWDTLGAANMVQFKQRIIAAHQMQPLSTDETQQYILSRLRQAGWEGNPIFNPDVFALIHEQSEGNPRKINRLCDRVLLQGFLEGRAVVDQPLVNRAIDELSEELMEKTRDMPGQHFPLAINRQSYDQLSGQASLEPFDLLFKKTKPKLETKPTQVDDEREKIASLSLPASRKRRILVGLGCAGLLCIGVVYLLLNDDHSPSDLDVAWQSQTAPLPSSLPVRSEADRSNALSTSLFDQNTTSGRALVVASPAPSATQPGSVENNVADNAIASSMPENAQRSAMPPSPMVAATPSASVSLAAGDNATPIAAAKPSKKPLVASALKKPVPIKPPSNRLVPDRTPSLLVKKPPKILPGMHSSTRAPEVAPTQSDIDNAIVKEEKESDEKAFSRLISRFSSAYEMGDVEALKGVFSQDASTPESSDRDAIIDAYKKLFNFTDARRVMFSDVQWAQEGDQYIGLGRFEATVREKGRRRQRSYYGEIEFHLENRDEKPIITYVAHAYDD